VTAGSLTPVFAALGDDTRWAILARLGEAPASASALAREFPISRLAALADPTRRTLLDALAAHGETTATALAADLPISRQAIVKHLELLSAAGLVESERVGREVVHRALGGRLSDVARELERIGKQWDGRLARIKRLAEEG
jgi:DNA-binding transcriptional ArsR family regulator